MSTVGKKCPRCGQWKLLIDFYEHPETFDYRFKKCKSCVIDEQRERRARKRRAK